MRRREIVDHREGLVVDAAVRARAPHSVPLKGRDLQLGARPEVAVKRGSTEPGQAHLQLHDMLAVGASNKIPVSPWPCLPVVRNGRSLAAS